MNQAEQSAVGAWSLVRWGRQRGEETPIYFKPVLGRLIYDASGVMTACLARPSEGDPTRRRLYAYSGHWRIEDNTAVHAVDIANVESWIGTRLTREIRLIDTQRLHLLTPPISTRDGAALRDILEWARIETD